MAAVREELQQPDLTVEKDLGVVLAGFLEFLLLEHGS
jgi:hypothetical protein